MAGRRVNARLPNAWYQAHRRAPAIGRYNVSQEPHAGQPLGYPPNGHPYHAAQRRQTGPTSAELSPNG